MRTDYERASIYLDAADYLDRNGWVQGGLFKSDRAGSAACLGGALMAVTDAPASVLGGLDMLTDLLQPLAQQLVGARLPFVADSIATWNDTIGRQKEEVTGLLRDTAAAVVEERELVPA